MENKEYTFKGMVMNGFLMLFINLAVLILSIVGIVYSIIQLDESKVNPYFIQAFFDSELGEEMLNYASGGSTVKNISAEAVKSIMIPLPPLEEQNAIAVKYQAALDEYGILQRKMQRLLERKRTLLNNEG